LLVRGHRFEPTAQKLRYFVIAAAISYAIPNLLMFSAIPHLGAELHKLRLEAVHTSAQLPHLARQHPQRFHSAFEHFDSAEKIDVCHRGAFVTSQSCESRATGYPTTLASSSASRNP